MEFKRASIPFREFKASVSKEDNGMYISGYASTFDVKDSHLDVMIKGAFSDQVADLKPGWC